MSIKILDSNVISQIAAGEVIERPASVVKELLENSLDAGANQISVEVIGGGINLIRVTDNGQGIPDDEVEMAFTRHATSKIASFQDLQCLHSLGFRGEALPSIAAVAQVEIVTCIQGSNSGSYLSFDNGKLINHKKQARSPGTTVTVRNLFLKVPARLKFLKSNSTETGRIADIVSRYALAYPEVNFMLKNDDKTLFHTPGSGKLIDSVVAVYGVDIAQSMLKIQEQGKNFGSGNTFTLVSGLVGSPKIARSTRNSISLFVNRRWVNNRLLIYALEEAYQGLLMQGKHPLAIVNISIASDEVDVNVHPAKMEIKFRDERAVFSALQKAVRQTLIQTSPIPQVDESNTGFSIPHVSISSKQSKLKWQLPGKEMQVQPVPTSAMPLISLPLLRVLGQLARCYIVTEGPDGIYIIDQHAAHERIQFEKIEKQYINRKVDFQGLLEPVTFEVEPRQVLVLSAHLGELSDLGFNVEVFGEKTYLVRSIPALLRDKDWSAIFRDALENVSNNWSQNILINIACHSAIRAGQVLSESEMLEIVKQLEQTSLPHSCPHGRPTMIQLTIQRLEKEFGRI